MTTEQNEKIQQAVRDVTAVLNTFGRENAKVFIKEMSKEHRTLQQSFTKLCFMWIENCADDEYRTDGRNQASQDISQFLLRDWKLRMMGDGFTGSTLERMSKPSEHLPMI